jgi:hypothetical protein
MNDYHDIRLEPYKVSGSDKAGLKIALPRITGAIKGGRYYIKKKHNGCILLVPDYLELMEER